MTYGIYGDEWTDLLCWIDLQLAERRSIMARKRGEPEVQSHE